MMASLYDLLCQHLGPPVRRPDRQGDWWLCPFHSDTNPATVRPDMPGLATRPPDDETPK